MLGFRNIAKNTAKRTSTKTQIPPPLLALLPPLVPLPLLAEKMLPPEAPNAGADALAAEAFMELPDVDEEVKMLPRSSH